MKNKIIEIFEDVLYEHYAKEVDATFSINVSEREIANKAATRIMEQLGECYVEVKATDEKKPPLDPGDSTRELSIDVIARKGSMWYITYWNYVSEKWKHHYPDPDFWLKKLPPHPKEETDWNKLREQFFEECVDDIPGGSMRKVNMAPHDLFEWMRYKIEGEYIK